MGVMETKKVLAGDLKAESKAATICILHLLLVWLPSLHEAADGPTVPAPFLTFSLTFSNP